MISPKEVITLVKQGKYDPTWRIYRGRSDFGQYGCAILSGISGLILFGFFFGAISNEPYMEPFLLVLAIACIVVACVHGNKARSYERSFLVLLPQGVVQCYAGDPDNHSWLYFPSIYRIGLAQETDVGGIDGDISSRTDYWLDVYGIDGSYRKCEIDDCYGDTAYICKTIIAAYNHYRRYTQFG